ncbi:MAG: helix-turn-helix domain-containing protein [Novosphingobium sp.]|nr:helix-turn-helix domain-containing protein [Novosphingobium sp.]
MSALNLQAPAAPDPRVLAGNGPGWSAPVEMFVACERQSLTRGTVRLDRISGAGGLAESGEPACRLLFQLGPQGELADVPAPGDAASGSWSVGIGSTLAVRVQRGGELLALSLPLTNLSRPLLAQVHSGAGGKEPIAGAARMCLELARSCVLQSAPLSPSVDEALGNALTELARLALIERFCTRRGETMRETVRTRIQAFIHRNLADPELTIDRIAEQMHCTKRYLHKIFSDEAETLSQYIWSQRLEQCRDRLSRAEFADRSITEIAFGCGFSNAAHFSHSFRCRFGQPPRAYRRAALAG